MSADNLSRKHSKQSSQSRRQALPRRSTRDPLSQEIADPLSQTSSPKQSSLAIEVADSQTTSRSATPSTATRPKKDLSFLLQADNFQPISRTSVPDAFKKITPPDEDTKPLKDLLSTGRFLAAADRAATLLRSHADPTDHEEILALFYIRLACLQLLGLHFHAAQESKALQDLHGQFYRNEQTGEHIVPWELRILAVRLQAIAYEDKRRCIMGYYELAGEARFSAQRDETSEKDKTLWRSRLNVLGLQVASALIEMGDLEGASRHLKSLSEKIQEQPQHHQRLGLVYLRLGDVKAARQCFERMPESGMRSCLIALAMVASGSSDEASEILKDARAQTNESDDTSSLVIAQNLAVTELYCGRIQEAHQILEDLVELGHLSYGTTFNIATMYELESDGARERKLALAQKAAELPGSSTGWQRYNEHFKL